MLKIYDSNLDLQAILSEEEYWDDIIEESINKEYYLTFITIIDGDKSEYIANDNIVEADGNYFQIVYFQKQRTSSGELLIQVEAWQVAMDLNDPAYNLDTFTEDDTPTNIMTAILAGTGFTVGTVDFVTQTTFSIQEKSSRRGILIQFAEYLGGELKFDKYSISLLTQRGADNGIQIRVGKNLMGITKDVDKRSGTLKTAYDVDMVELRTLSEFGDLEAVELGDTVKIIDSDVGANEKQRIVTYAYSPKLRISSRVVIANHLDGIEDTLFRIQRTTIVKEKVYNGVKIGPDNGFEAIASDYSAKAVLNATRGVAIDLGDLTGVVWNPAFYVEIVGGIPKLFLAGDAVFEGTVQASDFIGGTINIGSGVFTVDNAGNMIATSGTFGGTLDAVDGTFTGALIGGTIAIGSGNNIFKGDSNGIYLGNAVFGSAPFRVSMTGDLTATSATITGTISSSVITGSTITGSTLRTASSGTRFEVTTNFADIDMYDGINHIFRIRNDISEVTLLSPSGNPIFIGNIGNSVVGEGNWSFTGSVNFSSASVLGLSTDTILDHNHGVTPGRYLMTYDSGGVELGLQFWNASGGHNHIVS